MSSKVNDNSNNFRKKMGQMFKRDTSKIKTNPKYKCIDVKSLDGDEAGRNYDDYN